MKPKKKRLITLQRTRHNRMSPCYAESQNPSLKNENSVAQEKLKQSKKAKPPVIEEPAPVVEEAPVKKIKPVVEKAPVKKAKPVIEESAPVVEKAPVKKTKPVVEETPVVVEEKPKPKIKRRSKRTTKKTAE